MPQASPRLELELTHGKLVVELVTHPGDSSLTANLQLTHGELGRCELSRNSPTTSSMVTDSSPRVYPCVSSSAAYPPCLILLRALSTALITSTVARQHQLSARPRPYSSSLIG